MTSYGRASAKSMLVGVVAMLAIVTGFFEPAFLSLANLSNLAVQLTVPGVLALGMTFVIVSGGIDLSVGATAALASVVFGVLIRNDFPPIVAIPVSLASGVGMGCLNGILINRLGVAAFLATLGTMGIARGGAFLLSGGEPISGVADGLSILYDTRILYVPLSVFLLLLFVCLSAFTLAETVWGRRLYATGSNERAAHLAGIDVATHRIGAYVLAGLAAGIGGILVTTRLNSAQPLAGSLYELDAIAAVVIGGGSLTGGRGDALGAILGALLVVELRNAVTIVGLPTHSQPLVIGLLLLIAVAADARRATLRKRGE